ncbi:MAG: hypothetical protein QM601_07905 [Pseudoxanthomonas sp.]
MASPRDDAQIPVLLALELAGGSVPAQPALDSQQAGELLQRIARDLSALVPEVAGLDLSFAAAHFDPAEALRPGWPLHRRLDELRRRAPGDRADGPRLIAFGSGAGTAGTGQDDIPMPLQADPDLAGGALRVLPLLLTGLADLAGPVAEACETLLLERGMAGADTALHLQRGLGAQVEHARYLTIHDLAALTAMQYGHQNLEPLWPLIETALLAPAEEAWLDAPPEPLLHYAGGEARMALLDAAGWQRRNAAGETEQARLASGYEHFLARQRQFAAVLEAHGIAVTFVHCGGTGEPREQLCE